MMPTTLRAAARRCGFSIGAAVVPELLNAETMYADTLSTQFDMLVPENAMKAGPIHPEPGRFEFGPADTLVDFARRHDMRVRGHTLVWHSQLPAWLVDKSWSPGEWRGHFENHIRTVVGHFRGRVAAWDVVNEAVADDGLLRDTPWLRGLGPLYIERAFHIAHEADPVARLFYNDYGAEGLGGKSDAVFSLLQKMLENGVPVHGVGLQMHVAPDEHPPWDDVAANIERLGRLGLEVQITELDVRLLQPAGPERLENQARLYAEILDVCLASPYCNTCLLWGVTDGHSWIPGYFTGWGQALVFDPDYRPKPAWHALLRRFHDCAERRAGGGSSIHGGQ